MIFLSKALFLFLFTAALIAAFARPASAANATDSGQAPQPQNAPIVERDTAAVIVKGIALYLPNRIFDLLDIVRFRYRIGPGISAGVRFTEIADVFLGWHHTLFVGFPGSRGRAVIPWPAGLEYRAGIEVSVIDPATKGADTPHTDPLEISIEAQCLLLGFNIGLELFEVVDFATGIVGIDLVGDDL